MHLAVCSQLEKILPLDKENVSRFRIGQLLPDAVLSADKIGVNSHFIREFDGGRRKVYDFYEFEERFKDKLLSDGLYLGYYFHLIEDNIFRILIYYDLGLLCRRGDPKLLEELYRDYHILNGRLAKEYKLENSLEIPKNFESEQINEIYPFEILDYLNQMSGDFEESCDGQPKYFTSRVTEQFISRCVKVCNAEYNRLKSGGHYLDRYELSIENRHI